MDQLNNVTIIPQSQIEPERLAHLPTDEFRRLSWLQDMVKGPIEILPVPTWRVGGDDEHMVIICNEDAVNLILPPNPRASKLLGYVVRGTALYCRQALLEDDDEE